MQPGVGAPAERFVESGSESSRSPGRAYVTTLVADSVSRRSRLDTYPTAAPGPRP